MIASFVQTPARPGRRCRLLLGFLLLLLPVALHAQREFNVWCIGDRTTIDFNTTPPTISANTMFSLEGTASIADPRTGRLLFYTNGEQLFRSDGSLMPNGDGLNGNFNSTQSAMIIPDPGNGVRYYVFTSDAGIYDRPPNNGICYSVVDMSLDGGVGDVTLKNVPLLRPAAEKLVAVRDSSGCGYWVMAHGWGDDSFHAWHLDASGLSTIPVVSHAGSIHRDRPGAIGGTGTIGQMKISTDSRRLAVATYSMQVLELFDVDRATGRVSNPVPLPAEGSEYGLAFSPDNSKLYATLTDRAGYQLLQFDLSVNTPSAIAASRTLIHNGRDSSQGYYGSLQLASDGKIYMARVTEQWLGVVSNPNAGGAACNYNHYGLDLGTGRESLYGLPNIIDPIYEHGNLLCGYPRADFTVSDSVICAGGCVTCTDRSNSETTEWEWRFDGGSVATATGRNPGPICFDTPGTYALRLIAGNTNGRDSTVRTIRVLPGGLLRAHIARDVTGSPGDPLDIPIEIDQAENIPPGSPIDLTVEYRPSMMRLLGFEQQGTLSDGWLITNTVTDPATGIAGCRLTPPPTASITGPGRLLRLRFATWLDSLDTSSVHVALEVAGPGCTGVRSDPGFVRLQLCGLGNRLVESSGDPYTLDGARPNPFNPTTDIHFSLGLDGATRLDVLNVRGEVIATLLDRYMKPGEYTIPWNGTDLPSGLYFYRLASGHWSGIGRMLLVK